jgi:hypothetical protein
VTKDPFPVLRSRFVRHGFFLKADRDLSAQRGDRMKKLDADKVADKVVETLRDASS